MFEQDKANQSRVVGYAAALVIFLAAVVWTILSR
jgi:hypothetical protein